MQTAKMNPTSAAMSAKCAELPGCFPNPRKTRTRVNVPMPTITLPAMRMVIIAF
jgi:hypothetical protein